VTLNSFGFSRQPSALSDLLRKYTVWQACSIIPGYDATVWRYCANGRVIRFGDYGDRSSEYGWEIDHIVPKGLSGGEDWSNLRALHWRDNASLGGLLGNLLKDP
jgi:hypothetical protein